MFSNTCYGTTMQCKFPEDYSICYLEILRKIPKLHKRDVFTDRSHREKGVNLNNTNV